MSEKKMVTDLNVTGKKVLVRVDFNVPIKEGKIKDDTRVTAALPTIQYLLEHGAAVILMSHLGRPKGQPNLEFSLRPVAEHLAKLVAAPVKFAEDCRGEIAKAAARALKPGEVLVLENTRFYAEEEKNDPQMAADLASLADLYVNDAFGTAHRAHASTYGVAELLPSRIPMERKSSIWATRLPARCALRRDFGGAKISTKSA